MLSGQVAKGPLSCAMTWNNLACFYRWGSFGGEFEGGFFCDVFLRNQLDDQFGFSKDKDIDLGCEKCSVVHNLKTDVVHLTMDSLPKKGDEPNLETEALSGVQNGSFSAFVDASSSGSVMQGWPPSKVLSILDSPNESDCFHCFSQPPSEIKHLHTCLQNDIARFWSPYLFYPTRYRIPSFFGGTIQFVQIFFRCVFVIVVANEG